MRNRFVSVIATALALTLVLAACGSPDDEAEPTVTRVPDVENAPVLSPTPEEGADVASPPPAADGSPVAPEDDDAASPTAAADDVDDGTTGAESVTVESYDIYFEPTEVTIPADTDVTFELPNLGAAPHNFAIDELGIDVDIAPGETQETVINAPAGTYEFYCNVPGHREAGMVGTLIVE